MRRFLLSMAAVAALGVVTFEAQGQAPAAPATADPYASNPEAGRTQFPLAAPAGKDSNAKQTPPSG